jgi:hypothetical protein
MRTRLIPPTDERAAQATVPPTYSPRIFTNERGTFYMVASEPYWGARASMKARISRGGR